MLMHMTAGVQGLQADLAILRRKERSARVEVAQLHAKLTALDDFAGGQFEASLCATPSRLTCGMSVHGEESSVAGASLDRSDCSSTQRAFPHASDRSIRDRAQTMAAQHKRRAWCAGDGAAGTGVDSYAGDPESTPVNHSMVPYRSVPLQRVPSSCLWACSASSSPSRSELKTSMGVFCYKCRSCSLHCTKRPVAGSRVASNCTFCVCAYCVTFETCG